MIHWASIKIALEQAKEDLYWTFWEVVTRVLMGCLLITPVVFLAVLLKILFL